jgi:hypothetical protein
LHKAQLNASLEGSVFEPERQIESNGETTSKFFKDDQVMIDNEKVVGNKGKTGTTCPTSHGNKIIILCNI